MTDPLFYARAVHFAATIMAAGVTFFLVLIGEPALQKLATEPRIAATFRARLAWIAWISIFAVLLSGAAWLILVAASMSGQSASQVYVNGVLWTVLSQTDFGNDWLARYAFACTLAATFIPLFESRRTSSPSLKATACVVAAALVGSLAFAGHAIGDQGVARFIHPAADILHLLGAAAWLGALAPLALLLSMTGKAPATLAATRTAASRFSILGIVSVAALLFSGLVNTWYLVGGLSALIVTEYGQLLLIKIALFAAMVAIAAVNRLRLTPRLVNSADAAALQAQWQLRRNAVLEASIGAGIIAIVAALGMLPPGSHAHHHTVEHAIPVHASFEHTKSEGGGGGRDDRARSRRHSSPIGPFFEERSRDGGGPRRNAHADGSPPTQADHAPCSAGFGRQAARRWYRA